MRKTAIILIILVLPLFTVATLSPVTIQAEAWGLATHMNIASEAIDALTNTTWKQVFNFYRAEILAGSTTPDQAWQDWDNHLYYPETGEHNAPIAAQRWYNYTRDNFTAGNWEEGFFALGVMSHYFSDPNIPVHTNETWIGHGAYESDINANLGSLTIGVLAESIITNVSQMVVDGATYAHQFYDTVVEAYPYNDSVALATNATIKAFTESCLTNAINGCLSIFYTLTQYVAPPDVTVLYQYVALVDYAHSNDYIDLSDQLTSLNSSLSRKGFELRKQTTSFTAEDLIGVDLLIMTCGLDTYTVSELAAISNWASIGNKSIILTGRGDFDTYTDVARPNQVLEAIGSNIRVIDDNVYMTGTYNAWTNDLDTILAAGETLNLTYNVDTFTMFSPASLYFLDDDPVLPVIMADHTAYQTDQTLPAAQVIYDDVSDGVYGDQIPLAAVEEVGDLRVLVAGTTFFSDFDYGKTAIFDNIEFLENFLEWAVGDRNQWQVTLVDELGPKISDIIWDPAGPINTQTVNISAVITDSGGVYNASVVFFDGAQWSTQLMTLGSQDTYSAVIPDITQGSITFRIVAFDSDGNDAVRASYTINWISPSTTTTTTTDGGQTTPNDYSILYLMISVGVALLVVVVVVVIIIRRR